MTKVTLEQSVVLKAIQRLACAAEGRDIGDDIGEVIDGLCAFKAVEGWQPIETAPKDGTIVLLCDSERSIGAGQYMINSDDESDCAWVTQRFWLDDQMHCCVMRNPTHWQPLPAPPEGGEG